ncbi:unnamed protein product, partial [Ectocarpus sp. 8 AP-2014]
MAMRGLGKKTPAQPTAVTVIWKGPQQASSSGTPVRTNTAAVPLRTTSLVSAAVPWVSPTGPTSVPPAPLSPSSGPPVRLARPVRRAAF